MNIVSLIGAAIAAGMVIASEAIIFGGNGQPDRVFEEPVILFFNAYWAAMPFLLFAIIKKRTRKRAIGIGLGLTFLAWAGFTWDGWSYIAYDKSGGANIGFGIIMLIWPVFVFILMMVLTIRNKWERPHDGDLEEGVH